jgi:DNA polymerase I-like protein with 3'-5' exonuclease and polymerase domains
LEKIRLLPQSDRSNVRIAMANTIANARAHSKLERTYYQPLLERAALYGDERVHHTIHSTSTDTGRTSSANPNLQNQPEETRQVFAARPGSVLMEADFDQLEVIALAQLSACAALRKTITAGGDIHYETGKDVFGWKSIAESKADTENRRRTKRVVFGLIYGGGSKTLAAQSGFPEDKVRELIDGFYAAFPGVGTWQEEYYDQVVNAPTASAVSLDTARGCTVRVHSVASPTGRTYCYRETQSPPWLQRRTGCASSFSPTAIKNYPIQGIATGDWVPLYLVILRAMLRVYPDRYAGVRILNAVHDSVLLEVPDETTMRHSVECILHDANDHMWDALATLWGIYLFKRLTLSIKTGPTWSPRSDDDE